MEIAARLSDFKVPKIVVAVWLTKEFRLTAISESLRAAVEAKTSE